MIKYFSRTLALLLAITLAADPSVPALAGIRRVPLPHSALMVCSTYSRYEESALAPALLAAPILRFKPFRNFWDLLKDCSGINNLPPLWGSPLVFAGPEKLLLGPVHFSEDDEQRSTSRRASQPLHPKLEVLDDVYRITVTVDQDQPLILKYLTGVLAKHQANLIGDSRAEDVNSPIILVIPKNSIDIQSLLNDITALEFPRIQTDDNARRFSISVDMLNRPGAFNQLLATLLEDIPTFNVNRFVMDTQRMGEHLWVDLEVSVPDTYEKYPGKTPDEVLEILLNKLRRAEDPVIDQFEISQTDISEATAEEYLKILSAEESVQQSHWLLKIFTIIPKLFNWGSMRASGKVDRAEVEAFKRAVDLAKEIHKGEKRKSEGHPPYVVHPYGVVSKLIRQGVRDPVIVIAGLLHDAFENGPENLFRQRYPGEVVPEIDDHRMQVALANVKRMIEEKFPAIRHQLIEKIDYVTYYKEETFAVHIQQLTAKGAYVLALKLADMEDNLTTIFEVSRTFAVRQISKRIRFGLPIVSWETSLKDDVYINSRSDFLRTLILQSERLSDYEFFQVYYQNGEPAQNVNNEVAKSIKAFQDWSERNNEIWPLDIGGAKIKQFKTRLQNLREKVLRGPMDIHEFPVQDDTESSAASRPTLFVKSGESSVGLTQEWFGDNAALRGRFQFLYQQQAHHVLRGPLIFSEKGKLRYIGNLTMTAYENTVYGPTIRFDPEALETVKPYFRELFTVLLRWLKKQGFSHAEIRFYFRGSGNFLTSLFDALSTKSGVRPYVLTSNEKGLILSLEDIDVNPHPSEGPPVSRSSLNRRSS